jgi:hypothetical protein
VYELPCGPAAVVTGGRAHRMPFDEPSHLPFAECQALVPVPDDPSLPQQCVLSATFTSPSLKHWNAYMPHVVKMLRSIEFTPHPQEQPSSRAPTR